MCDSMVYRYKRDEVFALMRRIAETEGVKVTFLKKNQGWGGYNYGASAGDEIMLAPFKKLKVDGFNPNSSEHDCTNPLECMLISFFHELSHIKLTKKVPSVVKGHSWNDTSKFQFELWITMLGIEYAHSKYGIKFSDDTVQWMLYEGFTYAVHENDEDDGGLHYGLRQRKATRNGYEVVSEWEYRGDGKPRVQKRKG